MPKPAVLFLCTGNSARSQIAEALLRRYAGDRFEVHSAGTAPKGIHPLTRRALEEIGIDISGQRSKNVQEYVGRGEIEHLITVCDNAEESCPRAWPGVANRQFWPFEDPAACDGDEQERLAAFRRVRDQIDQRIRAWVADLP